MLGPAFQCCLERCQPRTESRFDKDRRESPSMSDHGRRPTVTAVADVVKSRRRPHGTVPVLRRRAARRALPRIPTRRLARRGEQFAVLDRLGCLLDAGRKGALHVTGGGHDSAMSIIAGKLSEGVRGLT